MADSLRDFKHRGKSVGKLSADGKTFHTTRVVPFHYVVKYSGFGMQRKVLKDLIAAGVDTIHLVVANDGAASHYRVTPTWWMRAGFADALHMNDGVQVFVSERQLQGSAKLGPRLTLAASEPESRTVGAWSPDDIAGRAA